MARFGRPNGGLHRWQIAHFPDQDDVRILPQRFHDRFGKTRDVLPDLALRHHAFFVMMHEFDRIFRGNDVLGEIFVDAVEHGRKRRRFTAARGARHKHQPARSAQRFNQLRRKPDILKAVKFGRKKTQHERIPALLLEAGDTKASLVFERKPEIDSAYVFNLFTLNLRRDLLGEGLGILGGERLLADRDHGPDHAIGHWPAHGQMNVRGFFFNGF